MRFTALATDYDGTLAWNGVVAPRTLEALRKLRQSGRRLILVTGREIADLESAFPCLDLFDIVVAENGALLYNPRSKEKRILAPPPPAEFVATLRRKGAVDMSIGEVIVGLWRADAEKAMEAIEETGLPLHVIFNKESVMVLPLGVDKATGLSAALRQMSISADEVVGIGDAENDHAFLAGCGCAVAVANAVAALRESAGFVTRGARGDGVIEIVEALLKDDLAGIG
jgi:hydroxymethylpyrimidine pyrophosphatase-like HAD family hydrolase